jgi:hypothetical protein
MTEYVKAQVTEYIFFVLNEALHIFVWIIKKKYIELQSWNAIIYNFFL